ncbi:glycosyl hydrolase family 3 C-terminal domain-containing protein [Mycena sp. CBHHK59/15]|nr:glycosyl hydrolase family 3 C-terminal domain-containing protein [Mycena sp. CBHHK59/15]
MPDFAMRLAPTAGVGVAHDWCPTNKSQYNYLQLLNPQKSRLQVPSMQTGECLHGVGSFKQGMFPQSIGIAASFDRDLAYAVGRAIAARRRAASASTRATLGPRPGGVGRGLCADVAHGCRVRVGPVEERLLGGPRFVKHFTAHGSPRGGLKAAPFIRRGSRQVLAPFKAVIDLGGAKGVMMAYNELDEACKHHTAVELVANYTIPKLLKAAARRVLSPKHDLGLFGNPYIPDSVDSAALTGAHVPLTLDAAHRSIGIKTIALIGPFSDILNYGDYSGPWGAYPTANSSTLRQAMLAHLAAAAPGTALISSRGANTWYYNGQYNIPGYLLSADGVPGGLRATYYADTNFTYRAFSRQETPNRDWGLYPPVGLSSNNFSVVWEGTLSVAVDADVAGWIGVGVNADTTARLFIDGALVAESPATLSGNIIGNIEQLAYDTTNGTGPPPDRVVLEFGGPPGPDGHAVDVAKTADLIVLAVGANWNSDAVSGDRATLSLSANQKLADAMFALGNPVVIVLQGGRPSAIPDYYSKAAAVLDAFFPGQSGGQAISDIRFGLFNTGGRFPLSVPYDARLTIDEQTLPVYKCVPFKSGVNYKYPAHAKNYTDIFSFPSYSFGYGKWYSTFSTSSFNSSSTGGVHTFSAGETINFRVTVKNEGPMAGSYVPQEYVRIVAADLLLPFDAANRQRVSWCGSSSLNDCWPVTSWAIADDFLRSKLVYFMIAQQLATVLRQHNARCTQSYARVSFPFDWYCRPPRIGQLIGLPSTTNSATSNPAALRSTNASLTPRTAQLEIHCIDLKASWMHTETDAITLLPNQAAELLALPCRAPPPHPLRFLEPALLRDSGLAVAVDAPTGRVTMRTGRPVKGLVLSTLGDGEDVRWSDNALDVMPGDPQVVVATALAGRYERHILYDVQNLLMTLEHSEPPSYNDFWGTLI